MFIKTKWLVFAFLFHLSAAVPTHELSEAVIPVPPSWEDIRAKFATFQKNVCNKLFNLGVDIEQIRLFVKKQFPPGDFVPPPSATLIVIFEAVTQHGLWNYFHYSPLVLIARNFGGGDSEIEGWVQTYKEDLKAYSLVAKLEDYIKADVDIANHPQAKRAKYDSHYCLPVEWKTKLTDHSLQYLAEVWEMFSSHYLMPESPPTALFDCVCKRKGCYSITWLIPSELTPLITRRMKDIGTDFFSEHRILQVTVGNQCVYEEVAEKSVSVSFLFILLCNYHMSNSCYIWESMEKPCSYTQFIKVYFFTTSHATIRISTTTHTRIQSGTTSHVRFV